MVAIVLLLMMVVMMVALLVVLMDSLIAMVMEQSVLMVIGSVMVHQNSVMQVGLQTALTVQTKV